MARMIKLTNFWGPDKELVSVDEIARVEECMESTGRWPFKKVVTYGSIVYTKNSGETYVAENPEQILDLINKNGYSHAE